MRHLRKSRRFGRSPSHRKAMFGNLVTSLFVHERILTTVDRARELRRVAEKLITLGKRGDIAARRLAAQRLKTTGHQVGNRMIQEEVALKKLFDTIGPRFKDRPGGYTRITKTRPRLGDNASMAFVELLSVESRTEGAAKGAKKATGKAAAKKTPTGKKSTSQSTAKSKVKATSAKEAVKEKTKAPNTKRATKSKAKTPSTPPKETPRAE
jgi:large subunit ribosomal protein L17